MALSISFAGKNILVTGGASGIGKAVVKKLYDDGVNVFVVDKDESSIENLKAEFPNITAVQLDLTDFEKTRTVVESFGTMDNLVNSAGFLEHQKFLEIDIESMKRTFDVNFNSFVVVGQVVARGMIANKIDGSIVNIASVGAIVATEDISSYCCSKAAVTMLTKMMALELGEHNIRVNCISPGPVNTPMIRVYTAGVTEEQAMSNMEQVLRRNIFKRLIEPSEIADLILFLLSPAASMITGENVFIDAGFTVS